MASHLLKITFSLYIWVETSKGKRMLFLPLSWSLLCLVWYLSALPSLVYFCSWSRQGRALSSTTWVWDLLLLDLLLSFIWGMTWWLWASLLTCFFIYQMGSLIGASLSHGEFFIKIINRKALCKVKKIGQWYGVIIGWQLSAQRATHSECLEWRPGFTTYSLCSLG